MTQEERAELLEKLNRKDRLKIFDALMEDLSPDEIVQSIVLTRITYEVNYILGQLIEQR